MRTNFPAHFDSATSCFAQQSNASSRTDVLTMNLMITQLRQQNIAGDNRFFARRRPTWQPEKGAPVTLVHHAVPDEIVVLAMIEYRQPNHARVLNRAPHQLMV